jgi:hypothetical protein
MVNDRTLILAIDVLAGILELCDLHDLNTQLDLLDQIEAWTAQQLAASPDGVWQPYSNGDAIRTSFTIVNFLSQHLAYLQQCPHVTQDARISVMQSALAVLLALTQCSAVHEWLREELHVAELATELTSLSCAHSDLSAIAQAGEALLCICEPEASNHRRARMDDAETVNGCLPHHTNHQRQTRHGAVGCMHGAVMSQPTIHVPPTIAGSSLHRAQHMPLVTPFLEVYRKHQQRPTASLSAQRTAACLSSTATMRQHLCSCKQGDPVSAVPARPTAPHVAANATGNPSARVTPATLLSPPPGHLPRQLPPGANNEPAGPDTQGTNTVRLNFEYGCSDGQWRLADVQSTSSKLLASLKAGLARGSVLTTVPQLAGDDRTPPESTEALPAHEAVVLGTQSSGPKLSPTGTTGIVPANQTCSCNWN